MGTVNYAASASVQPSACTHRGIFPYPKWSARNCEEQEDIEEEEKEKKRTKNKKKKKRQRRKKTEKKKKQL